MPFFGEFGRSSQDLGESDYDSIKSRDDRLNSSKSGMWIVGDGNTGDVLRGTEEMSSLEHRRCPLWNTGTAFFGIHEIFSSGHKKFKNKNVLRADDKSFCVQMTNTVPYESYGTQDRTVPFRSW